MDPQQVQLLFKECGQQEALLKECEDLVEKAQLLDDIAARTRNEDSGPVPINAPWRESYSTGRSNARKKIEKCPFCDQFSRSQDDISNFILKRNKHSVTMFNRNAFLPLHFLILPVRHIAKWNELTSTERSELLEQGAIWFKKLKTLGVGGVNFYFNLESAIAGATLPGHLHAQLLSRWDGDRSAITYLLGKVLIENERKLNGLLPYFYDFACNDNESEGVKKLACVFNLFSTILRSTCNELARDDDNCYVCEVNQDATEENDAVHLVIRRFNHWMVMVHRFGYIGGHLRVISCTHGKSMDSLTNEECKELADIMNKSQLILKRILPQVDGLNMGISDGRCSGAPPFEHSSCEIVPRIDRDTSAPAVICGRTIIVRDTEFLHNQLIKEFNVDDVS